MCFDESKTRFSKYVDISNVIFLKFQTVFIQDTKHRRNGLNLSFQKAQFKDMCQQIESGHLHPALLRTELELQWKSVNMTPVGS